MELEKNCTEMEAGDTAFVREHQVKRKRIDAGERIPRLIVLTINKRGGRSPENLFVFILPSLFDGTK